LTDADITRALRFHPQNNYGHRLPAFDILLGDPTLLPINALRTPHITPATGALGHAISSTARRSRSSTTADCRRQGAAVRILSEGKEQARVSVDFSRIQ
jgi:hypothetical protein